MFKYTSKLFPHYTSLNYILNFENLNSYGWPPELTISDGVIQFHMAHLFLLTYSGAVESESVRGNSAYTATSMAAMAHVFCTFISF